MVAGTTFCFDRLVQHGPLLLRIPAWLPSSIFGDQLFSAAGRFEVHFLSYVAALALDYSVRTYGVAGFCYFLLCSLHFTNLHLLICF